ncbi:MAG: hypothetical protein QXU52_00620 [Fervidicoccaceae archaeon]
MLECLVEGCAFEWLRHAWIVRGVDQPEGRVLALPRYSLAGDRWKSKEPEEAARRVELLDRSLLSYSRCHGRIVPLPPLRRLEEARTLSPLEPERCSVSSSDPACELLEELRRETGVESIGLTGSALLFPKLVLGPGRDVDLVCYGLDESRELYGFLRENAFLEPLEVGEVLDMLREQGRIASRELIERERLKALQGKRRGLRVYVRLVPARPREPGLCEREVLKVGQVLVEGEVVDAERSWIYPCSYGVETEAGLIEVVSDRGRFCELAEEGDEVAARGDLEVVISGGSPRLQLYLWSGEHYALPRRRAR